MEIRIFMAKKIMNERQFNSLIYKLVKESIDTLLQSSPFEADNSSENNSKEGETEKERKIRISVEKQLQKPGINIAPYAYKLDDIPIQTNNGDDNEHKNARSKLYKKLNHKPDNNGEPQYLSPEEAIKLKNELSSNLDESRKLRLSESDITYMVNESVKRILKESIDYQGNDLSYDSDMAKNIETKESWDEFDDEHEFYPSTVLFNAKTRKGHIDQDVDDALSIRNGQKYWNKKELSNRDKMMKKYIDGSRDEYDIEDAWDGIHY